jgi:hypothetical protein
MDYAAVTGTVLMPIQLVSYNDADINVTTIVQGDPASEKFITVLDEDVLQGDLAVLGAMTAIQVATFWQAAGNAWALARKPSAAALNRAIRPARRLGIQPMPNGG